MEDEIIVEGLEEFAEFLEDMTITPEDERKAMKKAIEPPYQEAIKNAPVDRGGLKKGIKKTVKKDGLGTQGEIKLSTWYSHFQEFGTSKSKKHVGFFSNSIDKTTNKAIEILKKELLDKVK